MGRAIKLREVRGPTHRVVMLAYPQAQILDIAGPLEVFSRTSRWLSDNGHRRVPAYSVELVAPEAGSVRTSSGIELVATRSFRDVCDADTLLVTGGVGFQAAAQDKRLLAWIADMSKRVKRLGSVCTGAFLLAAAGLLKRRAATTHWEYCDRLRSAEPSVELRPDAIFVRSGNVYTSAGVTAGMDLALSMVEGDWNRRVAISVAQQLVMFLKRPGGQSQFSRLLKTQVLEGGRFESLQMWMQEHLAADLSVQALSRHASMSMRNFARRFVDECDTTPAEFVAQMRFEAARRLIEDAALPLKEVARRCGFGSEQTLHRAFIRGLGIAPNEYCARFAPHARPGVVNRRLRNERARQ